MEDLLDRRTPEGAGHHEGTGTAMATDRPSAVASIALGMARIYAGEPGADRIRAGVAALARLAESDGDGPAVGLGRHRAALPARGGRRLRPHPSGRRGVAGRVAARHPPAPAVPPRQT